MLQSIGESSMNLYFGIKALVLNADGQFLAMHKAGQKSPLLELPGGRMEFGETIEETLVREMLEETGLLVQPKRLLSTWNYMKRTGDVQVAGIIYEVAVEDFSSFRLSDEHDRYVWLDFDQLDQLVPHFQSSLKTVKRNA